MYWNLEGKEKELAASIGFLEQRGVLAKKQIK